MTPAVMVSLSAAIWRRESGLRVARWLSSSGPATSSIRGTCLALGASSLRSIARSIGDLG